MTLRCKPGDLALVIAGEGNIGKMVTCLRLEDPIFADSVISHRLGSIWKIDRELIWTTNMRVVHIPYYPDEQLLPITPEEDPEGVVWEKEVTA